MIMQVQGWLCTDVGRGSESPVAQALRPVHARRRHGRNAIDATVDLGGERWPRFSAGGAPAEAAKAAGSGQAPGATGAMAMPDRR